MKDKLIVCPHCSFRHEDSLDYLEGGDMEGEFSMQCEKCEEWLTVEFSTTINYETRREIEK